MSKAPSESRIPTFSSRIPKPGTFRYIRPSAVRTFQPEEPPSTGNIRPLNITTKFASTNSIHRPACNTDFGNAAKTDEYNNTVTVYKGDTFIKKLGDETAMEVEESGSEKADNTYVQSMEDSMSSHDVTVIEGNSTVILDSNKVEATFIQPQANNDTVLLSSEISVADVGKKVCVGNVQTGVLKYVGAVQFNSGLWCGVELDNTVGRHDGCVKGVRYFHCREGCGIMAPVAKVTLTENANQKHFDTTVEINSDRKFTFDTTVNLNSDTNYSISDQKPGVETDKKGQYDTQIISPDPKSPSGIFDKTVDLISADNKVFYDTKIISVDQKGTPGGLDKTVDLVDNNKKGFYDTKILSADQKGPASFFDKTVDVISTDKKGFYDTKIISTDQKGPPSCFDKTVDLISYNKKGYYDNKIMPADQKSSEQHFTFDKIAQLDKQPVQVISADQKCSSGPYSLMGIEMCRASETYNALSSPDDVLTSRKASDQGLAVNPESVQHRRLTQVIESHTDEVSCYNGGKRKSCIVSGTLFGKNESLELDNCYPRHTCSTPISKERNKRKSADDSSLSMISPLNTDLSLICEVFGNATKKFATPLNSPAETPSFPKQNSFEMDESLGILTPDQMKEFSQFVVGSKTPSTDDLKSLVASKLSDKTISNSRTPSSENLGSLPHDGFKLPPLQNKIITRPDSIELKQFHEMPNRTKLIDITSPNLVDHSTMDFSLGLIDEDMLVSGTHFSSNLETTTNLDLPLDPVILDGKMHDFKSLSRSDQTPSPEDLPLDPIDPKMDLLDPASSNPSTESDAKTDQSSKSATNTKTNSFITSITSITSLDTGYQGDGEMSRPASRGADHSPTAHKPNNPAAVNMNWQRAIARRQDPMTDSDFFTESDADIHDESAPKGDRRAQVIDGTLYGANAQAAAAAADIYINNHEEMDSSGIFTDLDTNPRTDDFSDGERIKEVIEVIEDKSPSDVSTKSISENSQELKDGDMESTIVNESVTVEPLQEKIENTSIEKLKSPTLSIASTPGSRKSPRTRTPLPKEESPNKKIKMPKRNVPSKVKTMLETSKSVDCENQENRKPSRKTVNRWDAVMNKISKGQEDKSKVRLTQVKSKVATGIAGNNNTSKRSENLKSEDATKPKIRRVRARADSLLPGTKPSSRTASSIHSSISDLSVGLSPPKAAQQAHAAANRSAKKRDVARCATPVTEVLTAAGTKPTIAVSPRSASRQQRTSITRELKKSPVPAPAPDGKTAAGRRTPSRRSTGATSFKTTPNKDQSRVTGTPPHKGGSPAHPQVLQERTQEKLLPHVKHSAKGVEALGVLVQYLVFNLDAFRTPSLKRELDATKSRWLKDKLDLEETRMGYRQLEDVVSDQKAQAARTIEQERVTYRAQIAELFEKHRRDLAEINERNQQERYELECRLQEENSELKNQLDDEISNREHEIAVRIQTYADEQNYKFQDLELKNERLRQEHQIALEILREENDSIRDQLDEKDAKISDLEELRFVNEKLRCEFADKERLYEEKIASSEDEIALLKEENRKILETFKSDTKDNKLQAALGRCTQLQDEVESLRSVLDLKLAELSELRRAHGELSRAAEELPSVLVRCQTLQARVEDLEMQMARKTETELQLTKENKRLAETCNQETKQKKRLSLYNEELQWKLKQSSEVVNAILQGQTPTRKSLHGSNQSLCDDTPCKTPSGGYLSRSLHTSSFNEKHYGTPHTFERTLSFRERSSHFYRDSRLNSTSPNEKSGNKSSDYFELDDSPPSSPKVKGVVEKSDSVSWVLDMDESPEVLASRMVRRAGSFRNVTPPKSTPTKSPATKRPRTKSNNLSLSASAGAIVSPKSDNRHRSKSVSLRTSQSPDNCHPGEYLSNSWHYSLSTSTPTKSGLETIRSSVKLENNPDLEHDTDVAISLPALPSEISRKNEKPDSLPSLPSGDLMLLQSSFPKSSAGEAMISESNSEDECSSSTGERSPSVSDTETSEEPTGSGDGDVDADRDRDVLDKCLEKHSKMQYDLFLMTESTTNSEIMDCSWSEDLDA